MAALASDWLRHFQLLLWNGWTEFNETWQEARSQTPSTKFVFFEPIGKTRWPPWPLIGWDIFDFSSETAEQNSTKLDRKQDLNALYQVCVFQADQKNKMDALASDWLTHFRLLLWNCWTEFNETWQEAISQCPLPSLCFLGRSEKQDGRPGLWLAETYSTSPLKPLNRNQQNLIGSKISKPSTKFVFFGPIGKTRWPPRPLIGWDIFDFSVETAERNSTNLDRKQDLNALYQCLCFSGWSEKQDGRLQGWAKIGHGGPHLKKNCFLAQKVTATNRMHSNDLEACGMKLCCFLAHLSRRLKWAIVIAHRPSSVRPSVVRKLSHFRLLLWNRWTEFNET